MKKKIEATKVNMPVDYPWLASTKPYPHQAAASAWRRGAGLDGALHPKCAYEMGLGTGKTLTVIEEVLKLKEKQQAAEVLILAPNAILRSVWEDQFRQHAKGHNLKVCVLDGPMAIRKLELETAIYDVWIHNHESLSDMAISLAGHKFAMIVLDEHSKFRNHGSQRSKALLGQGRFRKSPLTAPYLIALSGTPVIKKASDVFVTYKWLGAPTGTITQYRGRHCIMGGYMGYSELAIRPNSGLVEMLDQHRFVIPKETVLNIPRSFAKHEVDLPDWQRNIYRRVQDELKTQVSSDFAKSSKNGEADWGDGDEDRVIFNHLTLLLRLEEVAAGFESIGTRYEWKDDNAKAKYLFKDLLPTLLEEHDKVIVWAWFRAEIRELQRMCRENGIKSVTYFGEMNNQQRYDAVRDFREGDAQIFIGQTAAAGLGLNLPEAKVMVYYSRSFNSEAWLQSLDRNYRIDSITDRLSVIVIEARNTIDQAITKVLQKNAVTAGSISSLNPTSVMGILREAL